MTIKTIMVILTIIIIIIIIIIKETLFTNYFTIF